MRRGRQTFGLRLVTAGLAVAGATLAGWALAAAPPPSKTSAFSPPPVSAIDDSPFGRQVALGRAIFNDPRAHAGAYVGNGLACSNCHLDEGRLAHSAPLWAAWVAYPQYRAKNGHVNTFAERLQGCFEFSENGKAPPLGDPVLVALESYAFFLARGAPTGTHMAGAGYPKLAGPASPPDPGRGARVFETHCAMCHGANGQGQSVRGQNVFPAVWGPGSYNWGAGMAQINTAAGFIKANMPLARGGSLTDQQAWDVAAYIDSQPRPQDPRFTGDVAQTRRRFHDDPYSFYGKVVDGRLVGDEPRRP
jgi:thiosulfate dehydrogenase